MDYNNIYIQNHGETYAHIPYTTTMSKYNPSPLPRLVSVLLLSLPLSSLSHTTSSYYHNQYEITKNMFKNKRYNNNAIKHHSSKTATSTPAFVTLLRGGDDGDATTSTVSDDATATSPDGKMNNDEMSLEDKVHKAMKKLGLTPPPPSNTVSNTRNNTRSNRSCTAPSPVGKTPCSSK